MPVVFFSSRHRPAHAHLSVGMAEAIHVSSDDGADDGSASSVALLESDSDDDADDGIIIAILQGV